MSGAAGAALPLLDALLTVVGGTIPAFLIAGALIPSRHPRPGRIVEALRSLSWRHWLVAAAIMFLIYALLFTTFFTNPVGLATGIAGSLSYWLAQQGVQRGGQPLYYYFLLLLLTLFGVYRLARLQGAKDILAALPIVLLLLALTAVIARRLGARNTLSVVAVLALLSLSSLTLRFAWMASFVNYDDATEPLVYAHGTPDVKLTMDEIARISQCTVGGKTIEVAYDVEASWPIEWYVRQYPNRRYYGDRPTRENLDVPLVIASSAVDGRVQSFLGERYFRFRRRGLWWPTEEYRDLTWQRFGDILASPVKRQALWDILYHRRYPRALDDWYHVSYLYFYVRKDVAGQLWSWSALP